MPSDLPSVTKPPPAQRPAALQPPAPPHAAPPHAAPPHAAPPPPALLQAVTPPPAGKPAVAQRPASPPALSPVAAGLAVPVPPGPPPAIPQNAGQVALPDSLEARARPSVSAPSVSLPTNGPGRVGGRTQQTVAGHETAGERLAEQATRRQRIPAWMSSFIVHLILILILAATPLAQLASGPLTIMLGFSDTAGLAPFELSAVDSQVDSQVVEAEFDSLDAVPDAGQLLKVPLPELAELRDPLGANSQLASLDIPFGITDGLKGRTGVLKQALLSKFGGTQETEQAVALGLKWLAAQQKSNGSWSLLGPYSQGGANENATAATALALNAFLGAGSTHLEGEYVANVKLGLAYLVRKQNSEGYFPDPREPSRQQMYAQALATIAVTEAYGMSGDEELKVAAQRAMKFAAWSQSKLRGWRYNPREDADLSVTGWYVMGMITGKMAGLEVDEYKLQMVNEFLDSVSHEDKSRYGYDDREPPSLSMTAEGLLCRIYLGWPRTHPALLQAIRDDLLPASPSLDDTSYSVYYWYYATQVLHHVGGSAWEAWNRDMRRVIPALQEKNGRDAGSWSPSMDAFGAAGGRLYTTCLNLYCLEVYYRHLSIYDIH